MKPRPAPTDLERLRNLRHSPGEVAARFARIYRTLQDESPRIKTPQFDAIGVDDLRRLFELYDVEFFDGLLSAMHRGLGHPPINFRVSERMTRAAGKTIMARTRRRVGWRVVDSTRFEIAISRFLLLQAFRDDVAPGADDRSITVAGVICSDRLEALLRVFEHELSHLAEFLASGQSSCSAAPFRAMTRAIFGHEASVHTLMTPVERAGLVHAITLGDRVAFDHARVERQGVVSRITKRATVLVPDGSGRLYSDGNRYLGFLVPLERLRKV